MDREVNFDAAVRTELEKLVRQMDASIEMMSAVRDFARGCLPAACDESDGGEFYYNVKGEKVYSSRFSERGKGSTE